MSSGPETRDAARPVLLAVDDEPSVARAVERDLRRRYGRDYRILRAESGETALAAVRESKLRGAPVALLLADQRMPGMSGVEFLEEAMRLAPEAKRVLLTAYADTQAAIDAINRVSLDHYLLKPWDPPDEQLYPVVDDLLDAWRADAPADADRIQVVGHRWSRESHDARDFLARNQVPYRWLDVERDDEARRLLAAADGDAALPLVLFPDGGVLHGPSVSALAERAGVRRRAELEFYDLVIVGGGPAGLAAAVYGASEGLRTALIEREAPGGQAGQSSRIENYLGFPVGLSGADLARRATAQASPLRRRAPDRAGGDRDRRARAGAARGAGRSRPAGREGDHHRHRGRLPPPGRARHGGAVRPRRVLRRLAQRGRVVPRRARGGRRRGELGRPGGDLLRRLRAAGDASSTAARGSRRACRST